MFMRADTGPYTEPNQDAIILRQSSSYNGVTRPPHKFPSSHTSEMCSSLSRQQWTARINRPQVETSHTPVFMVVPSPIAKVQATKKCICLVDHHNLFMVCPQENAHLCMVRVSKHLCLGVSTLTDIQKTNQFSLNKIKVCLNAFSMLNDLPAF